MSEMLTTTESEANKVARALEALQLAHNRYEDAHRESEEARKRATTALNALNEAQRKFDAAVNEVKSGAPRDSDWTRSKP